MEISKDLRLLAGEFEKNNASLYITGGYVRDSLLELKPNDIDVSSNLSYDQVSAICKKLKFKTIPINKNLGTLKIITTNEEYEYTRFRSESYNNGNHSPNEVVFVDDLLTDCLRRDITINSLYYKIIDNIIIDHVHGQKDLTNKIIRTTNHPSITLKDDGLRILRVIRFASQFGFKIDKQTYKYLKLYKHKLKDISKERILQEIKQIVVIDFKNAYSRATFMQIFNNLKIYPWIFNSSFNRIKPITKKDINALYKLSFDSRLIGFYFLILKNYNRTYSSVQQLSFACNLLLGRDGIKECSQSIQVLQKIYLIYQNLEFGIDTINASINYLTLSNAEREIIKAYLSKKAKMTLSDNISLIKSKNLPLGVHELKIDAQDLINAKIENKYISKILSTLFNQVIEMKVENEKDQLLTLAKNINETFITISKSEGEKNENNLLPPRRKSSQPQKKKKSR